jgi:beta-lactamase class A
VGVAVKDLQADWVAQWQGDRAFPQQSTMKIWLAVAVLDAVDRGELRLDEVVVVTPPDLSVFNSPMVRPLTMKQGRLQTTIEQLLGWAISKSDNGATDILMRRLGGGDAVQAVLERKGLRDVRVGPEERLLQPRISGLEWRPEYIDGDLFNRARDRVPDAVRDAALEQYLRAPPDGATPLGTVNALEALYRGKLLSPASTERLLRIMFESRAGSGRLKAGLPDTPPDQPGWRLSHKTGTGPDWREVTAGFNDVGVLVAPDGRAYAVAVYIGRTAKSVRERQALIAGVSSLVTAHWQATALPSAQVAQAAGTVGAP